MKQPFVCDLCKRAGRATLAPKAKQYSLICEDCDEAIQHSGRRWCNAGKHAVPVPDWRRGGCKECRAERMRTRREDSEFRARQQESSRRWKAAHAERHRAYQKIYHARNWEKYEPQRRKSREKPMSPPKGFITVKEVAARLFLEPNSVRDRLRAGWPVNWIRVDGSLYIEDCQSYPPMPQRLGPLQRALYAELEWPKATKALALGRSVQSVRCALRVLKQRGMVQQVSYGVWGRV